VRDVEREFCFSCWWALFAQLSNKCLPLSVTALMKNDQERVTAKNKLRLTLQALVTKALGS
jgi:hypothetical protein